MIYIIEIPHQHNPSCWTAFNRDDFISRLGSNGNLSHNGITIFDQNTARDLLEQYGYESSEEARADDTGWLADLAETHGLDVELYRSFDTNYTAEPIDEFKAYHDWLEHDLSSLLIFESDEEAVMALRDESNWQRHGGWMAKTKLEEELKRWDVLIEQDEEK